MNIFLNDQPFEVEGITAETTLLDLFEAVREYLKGSGLEIVDFLADGKSFDPENKVEFEREMIGKFEKLEFLAATAQQMIKIAVENSAEVLPYLEGIAGEIAQNLRIGKAKEAMEQFLELVDGLEWLNTILRNLGIGFARSMSESSLELKRKKLFERLVDQVTSLRIAQENQDFVGMADSLEYEFLDIFSESQKFFKELESIK